MVTMETSGEKETSVNISQRFRLTLLPVDLCPWAFPLRIVFYFLRTACLCSGLLSTGRLPSCV